MDSDEPTGWPGEEGFPDGGDDLATPADDELPGADLSYGDLEPDDTGEPTAPGGAEYGGAEDDDAGYDAGYDLEPEPEAVADRGQPDEDVPADPGTVDSVPGTDPDADPLADDESWSADPFPEALDLDQPPEPVDGLPWSDPSLLGEPGAEPLGDPAAGGAGSPPVADLYAYDGSEAPAEGTDAWAGLAGSEDPATSSLARFWAPGS